MPSSSAVLTFGPFRMDIANETLWRGQERLTLKPKAFAVLRTLLERPQHLVTKDELLNGHWGDVAVGDAVLKTCIGEIRQVLGEPANSPTFIETVHRRGYRFLATPTPTSSTLSSTITRWFVSREVELDQLHAWWIEAQKANRQIIFVTGEPGIGKTSLVEMFLEQVVCSDAAWIGRGHCIEQYGASEAYLPILEALGRLCRQPDGDRLVKCFKEYAPTWLMQLPGLVDPAELQRLLPSVIGATPVRMMRELADALEVFTKNTPIILSLEDLHWLDTSSLELVGYLARRSHPARLLVLGTYRPADLILLKHPLKQLKQDLLVHHQCQELQLECLSEPAVEEFLRQRCADEAKTEYSLHELAHHIHQRTEGNPLFMVNIVDHYISHHFVGREGQLWKVKDEAVQLTIPTGLRQFIDLRVEQLDAQDKRLLTVASITGRQFTTATIATALEAPVTEVDRHCHDLVDRELFIRRDGMREWPDGTVSACYAFQHALYQETLYEHIPLAHRIAFHRKIGERLEKAYGEHTQTVAPELALHFERGHDPDRASRYHQQAGEAAFQRSAAHEALLHFRQALDLLKNLPPGPERTQRELLLQSMLGLPIIHTQGFGSPEVERTFRRARELCTQVPGSPQLFDILYGLFQFYMAKSERKPAKQLAEQLLDLARQSHDPIHHIIAYTAKGALFFHGGDFIPAKDLLEEGLSVLHPSHHRIMVTQYGEDPSSIAQFFLGWTQVICSLSQHGLQLVLQTVARSRELQHSFMTAGTLLSVGLVYQISGDATAALATAEESIAISEKEGFPLWLASGLALRGWAKGMHRDLEDGIAELTQGITMLRQISFGSLIVAHYAALVEVVMKAKQYEQGAEAIEEALAFTEETGERWYEAELIRLKGEITLGSAKLDREQAVQEAEASFKEAITIAQKQGAKLFELRAVISLSRLWQQQGKGKQARPRLQKIYDWFTEGFDTKDLQEAKALMDLLN